VKPFSSKRRVAVMAALVLLVLFLFRPGASRLKSRIITSLSAAVGRPVDLSSVHVRVLPRPGFDLENLVVYDDPSFGSEPMLRASEVTADLRLISLLRGRLEVARLDLTEPSLNLVHRVAGGWNVESLLERTAHMPLAPTGKTKSEPRPGFPYIEGTSGRINLKNGPEKKPYALTNADFALWQDSENAWGMRLKAQPFRSDMNLNDTGLLQVSGTWQRARRFGDTPLQFSVEWSRAQLGQITKFFTGNDKGWRGEIRFDATVTGTPATLKISSTVTADDFRRYDIPSAKPLRLAAQCQGQYIAHDHEFRSIACNAPVGSGQVEIEGEAGLPGKHRYALVVTAQKVPASAIGALSERVKKDLPEDLTLEGVLQGKVSIADDAGSGGGPRLDGHGEIADFRVSSASYKSEFGPQTIPFTITNAATRRNKASRSPQQARLEFGPFATDKGRPGGAAVRGWVDRSGYNASVLGDAEVGRTLRLARTLGLRALSSTAEGIAQLNLQISGSWAGEGGMAAFSGPQVTGIAKLRNVRFGLRGTGEPVEVASADVQMWPEEIWVEKLNAKAAGAAWKGSLRMTRGCGIPEKCQIQFQLSTDELSLKDANAWAVGSAKSRPWYRVLGTAQAPQSLLARLRASGRVSADRFVLHGVTATKLSANLSLDSGKVEISSVQAELLGGRHRGTWKADFGIKSAVCRGSGNLSGISLRDLSQLMKDDWIEGEASGSYEIKGSCAPDFWQSAEGTVHVDMGNGSLPHVVLGDSTEDLKVHRFTAEAHLDSGEIEVTDGMLESTEEKYEVTGTATLKREIDFKLARVPTGAGNAVYSVTGTLDEPRVAPISRPEQAKLKP
jgi:hypothetical protein